MHFNVCWATEVELEGFDLVKLAEKLTSLALHVCDLVDGLLSADHEITRQWRKWWQQWQHTKRHKYDPQDHTAPINNMSQDTRAMESSDAPRNDDCTVPIDDTTQGRAMESNAPQDNDSDVEFWAQLPQLPSPEEEDYPMADNVIDMLDAEGIDDEGNFTDGECDDDQYFDGLEPLLEDPDGLEGMTDPFKEEECYEVILKMVSPLASAKTLKSTRSTVIWKRHACFLNLAFTTSCMHLIDQDCDIIRKMLTVRDH